MKNEYAESFLKGYGSILSLYSPLELPEIYKLNDPQKIDAEALRGDWITVGNDLRNAMVNYDKSIS